MGPVLFVSSFSGMAARQKGAIFMAEGRWDPTDMTTFRQLLLDILDHPRQFQIQDSYAVMQRKCWFWNVLDKW